MFRLAIRLAVALSLAPLAADALDSPTDGRISARMMQMPAVSANQIAFCYAGDIWIAPKARR